MTTPVLFASAYRQLNAPERAVVDAYVTTIEQDHARRNVRITAALHTPIKPDDIARSNGILSRPLVLAAIAERITQIAADTELTAHRVLRELMSVGFSTVGDYGRVDGVGGWEWDLDGLTPEQLAAIKEIKTEYDPRTGAVKKLEVKLHDKLAGLDRLAKFLGLLENDNEHAKSYQRQATAPATDIIEGSSVGQAGNRYAALLAGE